jgi:hypothetical protein
MIAGKCSGGVPAAGRCHDSSPETATLQEGLEGERPREPQR